MSVRLLADDLTGALDAAVRLVPLAGELPVVWDRDAALRENGAIALTTDTRDGGADEAVKAIRALGDFWRGNALSFKKIDSLWRGNTLSELAALIESRAFATVIIASAFPEQNRITREGRQYWRRPGEREWRPADLDLHAGLVARGIAVNVTKAFPPADFSGVWMFDAETTRDLDAIVAHGRGAAGPVLWCGSAGLAGALAGPAPVGTVMPVMMPATVIVGSEHAVSRDQVEAVRAAGLATVIDFGTDKATWGEAVARAEGAMDSVVFWFSPAKKVTAVEADKAMTAFFDRLTLGYEPPGALIVVGGETLSRLTRAAQATRILPVREITPGIALAQIADGRWSGLSLVSKSGAFGATNFIAQLLRKGTL